MQEWAVLLLPLALAAVRKFMVTELQWLTLVKYLTDEQHCNPSCLDLNKCTPLYFATIKGHIYIVKFLTVEKH